MERGGLESHYKLIWCTFVCLFLTPPRVCDVPGCRRMNPSEYYNMEVSGGRDPQSVCDELNENDANEDRPYRHASGGWFTPSNIMDAWTKIVYKTNPALSLDGFLYNATLRGNFKFPVNYTLTYYFQISTNSKTDCRGCLAYPNATAQQPYRSDGLPMYVQNGVFGQRPGLYYYQLVVVNNCGLETEEYFCANVVSYTINPPSPTRQPTTAPSRAPTSPTTQPTQLPTTAPTRTVTAAPTTKPVCTFYSRNVTVSLIPPPPCSSLGPLLIRLERLLELSRLHVRDVLTARHHEVVLDSMRLTWRVVFVLVCIR